MAGKNDFADRMVMMNTISIIGYGLFGSYITRAYMENLAMLYINLQSFAGYISGYLSNKLMDNRKVRKWLFDHFNMIQIVSITIDTISIAAFAITRNIMSIFVVDMIIPCVFRFIGISVTEVLNANLSGDERSRYGRKLACRECVCSAITNVFAIAFSALVIGSNEISFSLIIFIQVFVVVVEIITALYKSIYIYKPNVDKVYQMWQN